jgi:hypothetical protein
MGALRFSNGLSVAMLMAVAKNTKMRRARGRFITESFSSVRSNHMSL